MKKMKKTDKNPQMLTAVRKSSDVINKVTSVYGVEVPDALPHFVPFGHYDDLVKILASKTFTPLFITGPSGNGKTCSVEQACAELKRQLVVVSMTPETDESDLLGNYLLRENTMIWQDGPVTQAARMGAVLLLDEIDYGAANLTTLQRVLEGKPFLLKKTGEIVTPADGFTVVATANTKGQGSEDGRYLYTNVMNEAFLERFPLTFEQDWPPNAVEKKILKKVLKDKDSEWAARLVDWATIIRKTFADGGCSQVISTRRLIQMCQAYQIFGTEEKAMEYGLNRFDAETQASFADLYQKLVPNAADESGAPVESEATVESSPF